MNKILLSIDKTISRIQLISILLIVFSSFCIAEIGHWEKIEAQNNPGQRFRHDMAPIGKNKVLLFGGEKSDIFQDANDTWIFDLKTKEWTQIFCPDAPSPRRDFSMTQIDENKILLFGGMNFDKFISFSDLWIFNLDSLNWFKVKNNPFDSIGDNRCRHKIARFNDSLIISFAGDFHLTKTSEETYFYNYKKNKLEDFKNSTISNPPYWLNREYLSMTTIKDNSILMFGGWDSDHGEFGDTWELKWGNNMGEWTFYWEKFKNLKSNINPKAEAEMVHIRDGIVVLFGGTGNSNPAGDTNTWYFDYRYKEWKELFLPYRPSGRFGHKMAKIDTNKVLMYGGAGKFDTNTWMFVLDEVPVSVQEETQSTNTIISPNPASDYIEISLDSPSIKTNPVA